MPGQNNTNANPSPFEISTTSGSKKSGSKGIIIALIVVLFLVAGVVAGVFLVRQNQNIQEQASAVNRCPAAEQCPVTQDPTHLRTCDLRESDRTPDEQVCSAARVGQRSRCGGQTYCCPAAGQAWTRTLTACPLVAAAGAATPTPTATATSSSATKTATPTPTPTSTTAGLATKTPTATPTSTSSATATSTSSAQTTSMPIPATGANWPTIVGMGVGILVIVGSILLAL